MPQAHDHPTLACSELRGIIMTHKGELGGSATGGSGGGGAKPAAGGGVAMPVLEGAVAELCVRQLRRLITS